MHFLKLIKDMDLIYQKYVFCKFPSKFSWHSGCFFITRGRGGVCPTHKEQNISIQIWSTKISMPQLEDNMFAKLKHLFNWMAILQNNGPSHFQSSMWVWKYNIVIILNVPLHIQVVIWLGPLRMQYFYKNCTFLKYPHHCVFRICIITLFRIICNRWDFFTCCIDSQPIVTYIILQLNESKKIYISNISTNTETCTRKIQFTQCACQRCTSMYKPLECS